ncbi:MAG: hypothetical protein J0M02_19300 [Planctomycetes bacterium]|nr:hypothetical protein [Planctomycetota bacterium]
MSIALRLLHAAFAIALVGWLIASYLERRQELGKVQEAAESERRETQRMQADIEHGKALRDGLKRDDPYVIEYLARDRLQYTGPGELSPPPRP